MKPYENCNRSIIDCGLDVVSVFIGEKMDRKKSILNVLVSVGFQVITMIMGIVLKRMLIRYCGNDVNGLNALYLSVIGLLSVAELGVGSAITFGMYRPIVEGNIAQVSALYHLFDRLYKLIGGIIFLGGLVIIPFLPHLAADYSALEVSLPSTFFLMLLSSVLTYLFGAKTALINAYKNNYITTTIYSTGIIIQYILQAITLIFTRSFFCYLACRIVAVAIQWCITALITRKKYDPIIRTKASLEPALRKDLTKNILAMFMHKIGGILVDTVDSVVISSFIGVAILGKYSNYTAIMLSMTGVIMLVFTSLISVVGHMCATVDKTEAQRYCDIFHMINFCIAMVFYLGYFAISDNLISILFAEDLVMERSVVFVISMNGFVQFMRRSIMLFRDATGTFYNDRWKSLLEGVVNLLLSIFLVKRIGIAGVIVATIITALLICHIVEPFVLYKNAFSMLPIKYYFRNYSMIAIYAIAQLFMDFCMQDRASQWTELLINGFLSVAISLTICSCVFLLNKELRNMIVTLIRHRILKK